MSDQHGVPQPLNFYDPDRVPVRLSARFDEDRPARPDSVIRVRRVQLAEPWTAVGVGAVTELLQRRIVPDPAGRVDWAHYDGLDREISIGLRVRRGCASLGREYPEELSRVVGYNVDAAEPFVLFLPYRGEPVDGFTRRFLLTDQHAFEIGLLRAVQVLAALGVTHRGISPDTVLWNQGTSRVQVVDFSQAAVSGTAAAAALGAPWRCPADLESTDPRVDMWSAGAVLYHTVTGRRFTGHEDPGEDPALRSSTLQPQLARILAPAVGARPSAREVLAALGREELWPDQVGPAGPREESFERGGVLFDAIFPPRYPPPRVQPAPGPDFPGSDPAAARPDPHRRRRGGWPFGTSAFLVCLAFSSMGGIVR